MGSGRTEREKRRLLFKLGLFTILFFGGGGLALIVLVQQRDPVEVFLGRGDILFQLLLGTVTGLLTGHAAWAIIRMRFMGPVDKKYSEVIGPLFTRTSQRIWISLCAGVGEEIFFRGALQYWLGIPLTAILFVAIHGYLDPRDWRISIYGIFMTFAMAGLGWIAAHHGLLGPMLAHALIDLVLLNKLQKSWRQDQVSRSLDQS